jgi:hypothetical protein
MKFESTKVTGIENAIIGLRLPMSKSFEDAKSKSDSVFIPGAISQIKIGDDDLRIINNLLKADGCGRAGEPNSKFMRMIHVQVAITAPLYWWKEFDTYKVGTVTNSTSTMHKLASTPITKECFEMDDFENMSPRMFKFKDEYGDTYEENNLCNFISLDLFWCHLIDVLEDYRVHYNETKDKRYWKELIRLLPESWLQTRMVDCNYATLRNIYAWRRGHKLTEWHKFCDWILTLPLSELLIIGD